MRTTFLPALKTVMLIGGLAWISMNGLPLNAQIAQPGAFSQTTYPVGVPIYLAANDNAVRTNPPAVQNAPARETAEPERKGTMAETEKKSSWFSWFKKSSKKSSKKEDEILTDDGLEVVEWLNAERNYSDRDYVESATRGKDTSSKDFYSRGLRAENQGNLDEATRLYNAFVKANAQRTTDGTLAAPYHRMALITWKQQRTKEADIYFRYAMKYAQGGNLAVIAGDYSLFLMERGETAKAEVALRNALAHSPDNSRLLVYLGRCTTRQDRPIEALRYFTAAVGQEQAYVEMAHVYRQMGEWETALVVDEKRNDYLAAKQKRSIPPQFYVYNDRSVVRQSMPYPTQQPAATIHAAPATPVVMMVPHAAPPQQAVRHPESSPVVSSGIFTAHSFPVTPEVNGPKNSNGPEPVPTTQKPILTDEGWQPYTPAPSQRGIPTTGVYHYPAGMSTPAYHEYGIGLVTNPSPQLGAQPDNHSRK